MGRLPLALVLALAACTSSDPARKGTAVSGPRPGPAVEVGPTTYHVAATASAKGDGSVARPFLSIAAALALAEPGDTVAAGPGRYHDFATVRAGRAEAPIRVVGAAGAHIRGDGDGRLVQVLHDHVTLEGFEISDADILVWVFKATGIRIVGNVLHDARGECVRLKYFAVANEVAHNRLERCGLDFDLATDNKNGEAVYIGTAPEQRGKNPTPDPDTSDGNWVHDNVMAAPAECVDIKESASGNVVEHNTCAGSLDPDGAGFSARGNGNAFRHNTSSGHAGAGVRLGGDTESDGLGNEVVGNRFFGNAGYGVKVQRPSQARICGNEVGDNHKGTTNGGSDPTAPC